MTAGTAGTAETTDRHLSLTLTARLAVAERERENPGGEMVQFLTVSSWLLAVHPLTPAPHTALRCARYHASAKQRAVLATHLQRALRSLNNLFNSLACEICEYRQRVKLQRK